VGGGGYIWRIGNNEELNEEDIVKFMEVHRIRWLGRVKLIEVGEIARKMMEGRL